MVLQQERYL